jgi:hypothetical protein
MTFRLSRSMAALMIGVMLVGISYGVDAQTTLPARPAPTTQPQRKLTLVLDKAVTIAMPDF